MSEAPTIIFEERDALALVRLNRASKRNALTGTMLARLAELFAAIEKRRDLRTVIVTSAQEEDERMQRLDERLEALRDETRTGFRNLKRQFGVMYETFIDAQADY